MWRRTLHFALLIIQVVLLQRVKTDLQYSPSASSFGYMNGAGVATADQRSIFPVLAAPNKVRPGHHTKGYGGAPKPVQAGYPAARPPYRPPSQSYGPPSKPIAGYPASNQQHTQDVHITYPPAPASSNYPSSNYGPTTTVYPAPASLPSQGYLPPPSLPPKPIYDGAVSPPNQNYETPATSYPLPPPVKPDDSAVYHPSSNYPPIQQPSYPAASGGYPSYKPSPSPTYPASVSTGSYVPTSYPATSGGGSYSPAPSYPTPSGGGSYSPAPSYPGPSGGGSYSPAPSYPASSASGSYGPSASYPATPAGGSYTPSPSYPAASSVGSQAPSSGYPASSGSYKPSPSYPASSGSYYPASKPVGSYSAPVFIFIPKPGHFNAAPASKPVNYPASYPSVKPPSPNQQQYYPAPVKPYKPSGTYPAPVKPYKPSGTYPAAKPPNTSYGVPKAQPIYTNSNGAYRTDHLVANSDVPIHSAINHQEQQQSRPVPVPSILSFDWSLPASSSNPSTFQRGNAPPTRPDPTSSHLHRPLASPSIELFGSSQINGSAWPVGAESIEISSISVSPNPQLVAKPIFRGEFPRQHVTPNFQNDCGGSWVILDKPTGAKATDNIDPTQIQIEPLTPPGFPSGRFKNIQNHNLGQVDDGSFITLPPGFNELPPRDPVTERQELEILVFSTTPQPNDDPLSSTTAWRKPSSPSFTASKPILFDSTPLDTEQVVSNGFAIRQTARRPLKTVTSTENSVVFSSVVPSEDNSNLLDSPSPFLADVSGIDIKISKNVGQKGKTVSEEQQAIDEPSNSVIRLLREANLRAVSALMDQADIAALVQDKDFTLFAPSNAAFNQVTPIQRQRWIDRPDSLREMLLHHIIPGRFGLSSFQNEATPSTLAGSQRLRINIYNTTDKNVVTVNGAKVLTPDLRIGSLLVHVVDRVLFPTGQQNILDILNDGGLQSSLLGPALSTVLLSDTSPLTVFIPTADAFLGVSAEDQQLFLHNETAFHNLLWYHIVPGTYYSEGLEDGQWLLTLRGLGRLRVNTIRQNRKNKLEKINGVANVVRSDISATNGVVHFIDRVLTTILVDE